MISKRQLALKRGFDILFGLCLLPLLSIPIVLLVFLATIDTRQWGLFAQRRVGQHKKLFWMYKIRTLKKESHQLGQLSKSATRFGRWLRTHKLDEWPQVINVLFGQMSFVGPRPDVEGFADVLEGEDTIVLKVKPGITGPATLKYKHEEALLAQQSDPETYNRTIIWADKVEINKKYVQNWSFYLDLVYIFKSLRN